MTGEQVAAELRSLCREERSYLTGYLASAIERGPLSVEQVAEAVESAQAAFASERPPAEPQRGHYGAAYA